MLIFYYYKKENYNDISKTRKMKKADCVQHAIIISHQKHTSSQLYNNTTNLFDILQGTIVKKRNRMERRKL